MSKESDNDRTNRWVQENTGTQLGRGIDSIEFSSLSGEADPAKTESPPLPVSSPLQLSVITDLSTPRTGRLDAPTKWIDTPSTPDQVGNPDCYRLAEMSVEILDLSNPEQLVRYNSLLTQQALPSANTFIIEEIKNFVQDTGNWKVFLKLQRVQYKAIITNERKAS